MRNGISSSLVVPLPQPFTLSTKASLPPYNLFQKSPVPLCYSYTKLQLKNMTTDNRISPEIPDCYYLKNPTLICPDRPTPKHTLYLSNLDDQKFFRFTTKHLYVYEKAVCVEKLKVSLSKTLSEYYPLAGRLRAADADDQKLEVECNGEGAVFAEAFLDYSASQFLEFSERPNDSWRKLIYKVDAPTFLDVPPLVIQVTNLNCGGMILCTSIIHCMCDGVGGSHFFNAWAHITMNPESNAPVTPFHSRHLLKPRCPPQVTFTYPGFTTLTSDLEESGQFTLNNYLESQPLIPISITFNPSQILTLTRNIVPSTKCTTFEALASHTWKAWVRSLNLSHLLKVKLLFSVNIRRRLKPELPKGYFGNGIVLGCAETTVKDLSTKNLSHGVKLVQHAKSSLHSDYIRSIVDLLEDKNVETDLSTTLIITQWSKLENDHLDFGSGKYLYMGPLSSGIICLFLPVMGDPESVRVSISLPRIIAEKFKFYMTEGLNTGPARRGNEEVRLARAHRPMRPNL